MEPKNKNDTILDRFLLVYEVRMNETGDRWAVIYAEPKKEGVPAARTIVERTVEVSPLAKKCWKSIDVRGNRIGYFWEYLYPVEVVPNEDYYSPEYYIDQKQWSTNPPEQKISEEGRVLHDNEATYQTILQDMIAKYLIVKYSILDTGLKRRLEEISVVDKYLHTKELAEEVARQAVIKTIPEDSKSSTELLDEGGWNEWREIAKGMRIYKQLIAEGKVHEIAIEALVGIIITIATAGIGAPLGLAASIGLGLAGAAASTGFAIAFDPKQLAENIIEKEKKIYLHSTLKCNTKVSDFEGCFEAQALPGSVIKP